MKSVFLIIFIIFLAGCIPYREIIYVNKTVEMIKECPDLVCPDQECVCNPPDCNCYKPECKTDIRSVITDACTKKLNMCNLRADFLNDELFKCMISNNTEFLANLTIELDDCKEEVEELKEE